MASMFEYNKSTNYILSRHSTTWSSCFSCVSSHLTNVKSSIHLPLTFKSGLLWLARCSTFLISHSRCLATILCWTGTVLLNGVLMLGKQPIPVRLLSNPFSFISTLLSIFLVSDNVENWDTKQFSTKQISEQSRVNPCGGSKGVLCVSLFILYACELFKSAQPLIYTRQPQSGHLENSLHKSHSMLYQRYARCVSLNRRPIKKNSEGS